MQRTAYLFLLVFVFASITKAADDQLATVIDVGGTATNLRDLTTNYDEFGGIVMGSSGIPIVIKDFLVGPQRGGGAAYRRWIYLDEIEHIGIKQGDSTTVIARLRTGVNVSGSFGSVNPDFVMFYGKSDFGDFSLDAYKVQSITRKGSPKKRHPNVMGTKGAKATITLRDGTVLAAEAVQRHCIFPSKYINVRDRHEHYASVWIRSKRGEASVETELPFNRLKEIVFDTPVVTSTSYSGGTLCKVTLRDGSSLAGDCEGSDTARRFNSLVGRTDDGPFEVVRDLGYAVKTIQFAE